MNWYLNALKKYATFQGRARRKEYWYFLLVHIIIVIVLAAVDGIATMGILSALYMLGVLIPSLALAVRRLHDTNRSGWWVLISLIPAVGAIVLIVFFALDGTPGENPYGPNPKEATA